MTTYRRLHEFSRRQYRFVTYRQAVEHGVSPSTLGRWVDAGTLDRAFRRVYGFPGARDDALGMLRAATLAIGEPVHAYGRTALWLHGALDVAPEPELVIPHGRRAPDLPNVTVHRSRTLLAGDAAWPRRVPATTPARALADVALSEPPRAVHALVLDALQRGTTTIEHIASRAAQRLDVRSRRGLAYVLALIEPERPDSILEAEVRQRLAALGYRPRPAPWRLAVEGRVVTVDIAFPEVSVGIECDGFAYHADRASMDRDHRKTNLLQAAGWSLLRVSWDRVWEDWDGFLEEFRTAAARHGLDPPR